MRRVKAKFTSAGGHPVIVRSAIRDVSGGAHSSTGDREGDLAGVTALMLVVCADDDPHQVGLTWSSLLKRMPNARKGERMLLSRRLCVVCLDCLTL